ncbi:GTP 3',8-cyclase MoaA [Clostridium polyendosporum]|nr:GTP 3',8-cyclase MoaA [Clostridium polyendosporum]
MLDKHSRKINYLRLSVTDRCNLRCIYCMPKEGVDFTKNHELLTIEEMLKIVKSAAELGIKKVRITGGEPLLRNGVIELISKIKSLSKIQHVYLTTNGILLDHYMDQLIKVGLDGINISLDSLREDIFEKITRGGNLQTVLKSIETCDKEGIKIKLNTVILKGVNDKEILDFVYFSKKSGLDIRFIELMPIGESKGFKAFTTNELKNYIQKEMLLIPCEESIGDNGPAAYYKTTDSRNRIGFISPISHSFCHNCNRIRVTSEGFLKQCLHWKYGIDLKTLIRRGIGEEELKKVISDGIFNKPKEHNFKSQNEQTDIRLMSQIGG